MNCIFYNNFLKKICVLFATVFFTFILFFQNVFAAKLKQKYEWLDKDGFHYFLEDDGSICTDLRKYFDTFSAYYISVNKKHNTVTIMALDCENNFSIPVVSFLCSCGSSTPSGVFLLNGWKAKWRLMYDGSYGKYCTRIVNDILFHSIPYEEQDSYKMIVEDYTGLGTVESAGCVRLRAGDAYWIYKNIKANTPVNFNDNESPGPFGKPKVDLTLKAGQRYDPTDPDIKKK